MYKKGDVDRRTTMKEKRRRERVKGGGEKKMKIT